ncbi:MAG TPA: hypothetical protein V6D11_20455 [Waterburya sp.]
MVCVQTSTIAYPLRCRKWDIVLVRLATGLSANQLSSVLTSTIAHQPSAFNRQKA